MTTASQPAGALTSLAQITAHFRDSPQTIFYLSRSATNLVGIDRWVRGFHYITLSDSWNGAHRRSFTPSNIPSIEPRGNINIANWLLENEEVQTYIAAKTPCGARPQIVLAMFDQRSEQLCAQLGYDLIMPSVKLRSHLDSKLVTTQLGNEAGAESVPNILTTVTSWEDLRAQAERSQLGDKLVIQLPYGDSGRTTYFVNERADFDRVADSVVGAEVKIMRHINHQPLAAEAVITSAGTVVGPVLREITGHPELTAYRGGWSGSEMYPGLVNTETRDRIGALIERFCARLADEGYRGVLEVSILLDTDTQDVYLGELNPRISGSSAHSNLTPGDTTLPLFVYHLLEYANVPFSLDLGEIKAQRDAALDGQVWSTLVIQYAGTHVDKVNEAAATGRYRITDTGLSFIEADPDWQNLTAPDEVFWLSAVAPGAIAGPGVDLGMLVFRGRAQEEHYALTPLAKRLIRAVQTLYRGSPIPTVQRYWRAGVRLLREKISR